MHGSYFSGRINVERSGEQCYLGYHNSQKDGGMFDGTGTQVKVQMINKCKVLMISNGLYKRGGVPMKKGPKKGGT